MSILINIFKLHFKIIYFFLKLLPTNTKKVILISRQFATKSLDFRLFEEKINEMYPDYKVVIITRKLEKNIPSMISYYFNLYKQMYHLATSSAGIVDTYIIPVSILKHKPNLLIVQLCHGVGTLKKFGYQTLKKESGRNEKLSRLMNMHQNYDYIISTSKRTSDIYAKTFNFDIKKMLNFGPPKIDYILKIHERKDEVLKKYPDLKSKPVILYVSTFRTYKNDYLDKFIEHLPLDKYNIIIHLHPVIYSLHPELDDKANIPGVYRCKDIPTVDLLSVTDYAITDYSSFIFESAILGIPTYSYAYDYDQYVQKNGFNIDLFSELKGCIYRDAKDLFDAIENKKYDFKNLKRFKDSQIENTQGNATEKLVELIVKGKNK